MDNQYKRTLDKVKVDDSFKRELKETLLEDRKEKSRFLPAFQVITVMATFMLIFGLVILNQNMNNNESIYTLNQDNPYYQLNDEVTSKFFMMAESSNNINTEGLILVELTEVRSYVNEALVYTDLKFIDYKDNTEISLTIDGGTISKDEWNKEVKIELDKTYKNEDLIRVIEDYEFDLIEGELYFIRERNESYEILQARENKGNYETYFKESDEWIKVGD